MKLAPVIALLLATLTPHSSRAVLYTVNAVDRGWYDSAGVHGTDNLNYLAGFIPELGSSTFPLRNWFVFDLSGLPSGSIATAILSLRNPSGGFVSVRGSEAFAVGSISTPISILTDGTGGVSTFNALAIGTAWGIQVVTSADNGQFVQISLNSSFSSSASSLLGAGQIALGGHVVGDQTFNFSNYGYVFSLSGDTDMSNTRLTLDIVPVPEPSQLPLVGLGAIAWLTRNGFRRT